MRLVGILLICIAAVALFGAVNMDTSVATSMGSRVHNLGLMRSQQNGMLLAVGLFIGGIILYALGGKKSPAPSPTTSPNGDERELKKCPFCAEFVKREAIKCRYCNSDLENTPATTHEGEVEHAAITQKSDTGRVISPLIDEKIQFLSSIGCKVGRWDPAGWNVTFASGEIRALKADKDLVELANDMEAYRR